MHQQGGVLTPAKLVTGFLDIPANADRKVINCEGCLDGTNDLLGRAQKKQPRARDHNSFLLKRR